MAAAGLQRITMHSLKTATPYWDAIWRGDKTFEVRRDDRGYQRGDVLLLRRLHPKPDVLGDFQNADGMRVDDEKHAATIEATITYILTGGQLGIEPGYVVMGLDITRRPAADLTKTA